MKLELGNVVVNFGVVAKVVGFFAAADGGDSDHAGDPILRAMKRSGVCHGGKWVADPAKCEPLTDAELFDWYGGVHLGH